MTQTTKMVNRKVTIALAILCVASLVALNFSVITYYTQMTNKNNEIQTLNNQIVNLQTQMANGSLPAPKLISIDMNFTDNRSDSNAPFLHVTGYIFNVGTSTANSCVLHVTAVRADNSTGIDTATNLESIVAGNYTKIDVQFPYSGNPLTKFNSTVEWLT
jgi:hypothetical protein